MVIVNAAASTTATETVELRSNMISSQSPKNLIDRDRRNVRSTANNVCGESVGNVLLHNPITGIAGCCASRK
jgi:hypothetical protein